MLLHSLTIIAQNKNDKEQMILKKFNLPIRNRSPLLSLYHIVLDFKTSHLAAK
jgi:hypothetical protein